MTAHLSSVILLRKFSQVSVGNAHPPRNTHTSKRREVLRDCHTGSSRQSEAGLPQSEEPSHNHGLSQNHAVHEVSVITPPPQVPSSITKAVIQVPVQTSPSSPLGSPSLKVQPRWLSHCDTEPAPITWKRRMFTTAGNMRGHCMRGHCHRGLGALHHSVSLLAADTWPRQHQLNRFSARECPKQG